MSRGQQAASFPGAPGRRLMRAFFARPAATVAEDLLGKHLCIGTARVRIVETEAYVGPHDAASHSRTRTRRSAVMFGPPGHAYVYFVYGLHHMLNVVTGPVGSGEAVLLRAAEPVAGIAGRLDGPARLAKALGIHRGHDGMDLCGQGAWFEDGTRPMVERGPRIGVEYAGAWADAPLRFWDAGSRHVSRPADRPVAAGNAGGHPPSTAAGKRAGSAAPSKSPAG